MKKEKSTARSSLGLMASGVATITIDQKMPRYNFRSNAGALNRDRQAIVKDARKAFSKSLDREHA